MQYSLSLIYVCPLLVPFESFITSQHEYCSDTRSVSRYDWHDDSGGGETTDVYRSLTSDKSLSRSPSLDSLAQGALRRGDEGDGYLPLGDRDDDFRPGTAEDREDDKDDGGVGFSINSLSEEKRRLLTEILVGFDTL